MVCHNGSRRGEVWELCIIH